MARSRCRTDNAVRRGAHKHPSDGDPTTALITSGPYRFTRNPQYLGIAALYIAFAFGLGVLWALAFLPVVLLIVDRHVIPREERYLEAKFGDEYREYMRRVRRWL